MSHPIEAIFENGVFRPLTVVELPEHCHVLISPQVLTASEPIDLAMQALFDALNVTFDSGEHDVAARHNEHQP